MAMALHQGAQSPLDNRKVVLLKSEKTNNRFYTLVEPETGIKNADVIHEIPDTLLLGIAYPCLEDGLNDFAVIRTTFETLDYFPGDKEMRDELFDMISDSRTKLSLRLAELKERIAARKAHFLGTDLEEFKSYALDMVHRGYPRRNLDSMMKLDVFSSVAEAEGHSSSSEPLYHFEFREEFDLPTISMLPPRDFLAALFEDVLKSVQDDANYVDKYVFDKNVFQKFIALMFVNYATTDPIFYGTNKADYGVSTDKEMEQTPLYMAIARELREIEHKFRREEIGLNGESMEEAVLESAIERARNVELPATLINEDVLLGPIAAICTAARHISKIADQDADELSRIILANASQLVQELKRLNIISPFARDPGAEELHD